MRPYSPGGELNALASTLISELRPTSSSHRLGRGLPGYLILFAPHAFVPQCQLQSRKPPSPLVFLLISTHFTATLGIPLTSPILKSDSFKCLHWLSQCLLHLTYQTACVPFTPSNSGQRSPPTYYRGCWHVVSRGFLPWYRLLLFPWDRGLRPESLLPSRGVAGSGFPPLPNIPHCCLP